MRDGMGRSSVASKSAARPLDSVASRAAALARSARGSRDSGVSAGAGPGGFLELQEWLNGVFDGYSAFAPAFRDLGAGRLRDLRARALNPPSLVALLEALLQLDRPGLRVLQLRRICLYK